METMNDFDLVRRIVEMVTGMNIFAKNRKRNVVEARMLYGLLLREIGHSLPAIAESLNKDHTTIIHYVRTMKGLLDTDKEILRRYLKCRELIVSEKQPVNLLSNEDYKIEAMRLKDQLEVLKAENYLLNEEKIELTRQLNVDQSKRLTKIFNLIEDNTPTGYELIVERKIRKMFDD